MDVASERKGRSLVLNPSNLKTGLLLNEMGKVPTDGAHSWEGEGRGQELPSEHVGFEMLVRLDSPWKW